MTDMIVIGSWAVSGIGIATIVPGPDGRKAPWWPLAAVFGPLWLSIAVDRRSIARASHRRTATIDLRQQSEQLAFNLAEDAAEEQVPYQLQNTA